MGRIMGQGRVNGEMRKGGSPYTNTLEKNIIQLKGHWSSNTYKSICLQFSTSHNPIIYWTMILLSSSHPILAKNDGSKMVNQIISLISSNQSFAWDKYLRGGQVF